MSKLRQVDSVSPPTRLAAGVPDPRLVPGPSDSQTFACDLSLSAGRFSTGQRICFVDRRNHNLGISAATQPSFTVSPAVERGDRLSGVDSGGRRCFLADPAKLPQSGCSGYGQCAHRSGQGDPSRPRGLVPRCRQYGLGRARQRTLVGTGAHRPGRC